MMWFGHICFAGEVVTFAFLHVFESSSQQIETIPNGRSRSDASEEPREGDLRCRFEVTYAAAATVLALQVRAPKKDEFDDCLCLFQIV